MMLGRWRPALCKLVFMRSIDEYAAAMMILFLRYPMFCRDFLRKHRNFAPEAGGSEAEVRNSAGSSGSGHRKRNGRHRKRSGRHRKQEEGPAHAPDGADTAAATEAIKRGLMPKFWRFW